MVAADRISQLPEEIVAQIVSHLNMKEALAMLVLSKNWINFWTNHLLNLHTLDFDSAHFRTRNRTHFLNYVDQVLRFRGIIDVDKFSLKFHEFRANDLPRICPWIRYAIVCNVKKLELQFETEQGWLPNLVSLPSNVFLTFNSLVELKLKNDFVFDVPPTIPCLKILHVDVKRPNTKFLNRLFRSCENLEKLSINGVLLPSRYDEIAYIFVISNPALRKLEINMMSSEEQFEGCSLHHLISIQTPNLEYLKIEDEIYASYELQENINSLIEANVCFGPHSSYIKDGQISVDDACEIMDIVEGITHAKSIILWENTMAVIGRAIDDFGMLPEFSTLNRLELCIDDCYGWKLLPHLLSSSPNLEILQIDKQVAFNDVPDGNTYGWEEPEAAPSCLGQHLKEIKLTSLWRSADEEKVVTYLLGNCMVLEKMTIKFSQDNALEGQFNEAMIEEFPRASDNCELIFERNFQLEMEAVVALPANQRPVSQKPNVSTALSLGWNWP